MKILILASNPRRDLKLNEEIRDLKGVIERSRNQKQLEVEVGLAVRPGDLQELLLKHEPEIVHFCGHGTGEQGLVFQNEAGQEQLVSTDALSNLFELFSEKVSCILLNACYSEIQANAMIQHINYVIGMNQEIRDDAAIAFAVGFYRALGYGRSIEQSYKLGCNEIQLHSGNSVSRSVVSEEQRKLGVADVVAARKVIPEHLKPIIKKKANLTLIPDSDVSRPDDSIAAATQVEIQRDIGRAVDKEIALKQYREKVKEFLSDSILTDFENIQLDVLKEELGLSDEEAEKISEEELVPIKEAQQSYNKMLSLLIRRDFYPFNEDTKNGLKKFQVEKNLTDEEVEQISQPILKKAEVEYQVKLRQRYEQEFKQVVEAGYPINEVARNSLKNLQQSLGLSNEDVASTEQPIIALKEAGSKSTVHKEQLSILNETTFKRSQGLSDSEIKILTDLLLRSGRAEFCARRALCIRIGIEPSNLQFFTGSDADFALQLITYLQNTDNRQAFCKICNELEPVFKRGLYFADLSNIKLKLNCK